MATIRQFRPQVREPADGVALRQDLENHSCAAVRVLSQEEVDEHAKNFLAVLRQVRPDEGGGAAYPSTPLGARGCGFVPNYAHAQHEDVWALRTNEKLQHAMANVYGATPKDMAVSADNVYFWGHDAGCRKPPTKAARVDDDVAAVRKALGSTLNLHIDVGVGTYGADVEDALREAGYYGSSLQAQIPLLDVTEESAGLVLVDGDVGIEKNPSHFDALDSDYCAANAAGYSAFRHLLVKPCVPAGCAIIWKSCRVHANCKAAAGADPTRLGLFVTWQPRVLRYDRERKYDCILNGMTSTHWPMLVPDGRSQNRWQRPGSHMSNRGGACRVVGRSYTDSMMKRIWSVV